MHCSCSGDDLNSTDVVGKIVLCLDGTVAAGAGLAAQYFGDVLSSLVQAKAEGVIFARFPLSLLQSCQGLICVLVDNDVLLQILAYGVDAGSPVVKVNPAYNIVGSRVMSPRVAAFSSRGPSISLPEVIKPDITAPGASILAAVQDSYKFESGTSMSCPHVAGIAALLKSVHPQWSPAAIKSALVTTAYTTNAHGFPIEADGIPRKLADPFDLGGGQIDPNRAADPGLIYDIHPKDYFKFFHCTYGGALSTCDLVDKRLYHLNLPSISIPHLNTSVTVLRTVTNVGNDANSIYKAAVQSPPGVKMAVEPCILEFNASKTLHTFALTFTPLQKVQGDFRFGSLTWRSDGGKHSVRIPIAVRVIIQDSFSDTS